MHTLGIIGGMGSQATAVFMEMLAEMTDADADSGHITSILYNCPSIPNPAQFILGESTESPAPALVDYSSRLARQGADVLAIPSMSASYFLPQIREAFGPGVIDIAEEICLYLEANEIHSAGLMASLGTIGTGVFQEAFRRHGLKLVLPSASRHKDIAHIIVDNVKAGKPVELGKFFGAAEDLWQQGANVIILGCAELSVVHRNYPIGAGFLDALQLLARCCVQTCATLRPEYTDIITEG